MASLIRYVPETVLASRMVHAVGLTNLGNTCYMNTVVQALLSCPAFCVWLVQNSGRSASVSEFAQVYLQMAMPQIYPGLLNIGYLVGEILGGELRIGRQEDADACFHRILDVMHESTRADLPIAANLESVFAVRYGYQLHCRACGHRSVGAAAACPTQTWMDIPPVAEYGSIAGDRPITTEAEFTQYIRSHRDTPRDYTCDKCKARNTTEKNYSLARISPICVLIFKKYHGKTAQFFPKTFSVGNTEGNMMHYDIVAQIEQSGNMGGGHYYAIGQRLVPGGASAAYTLNDSYTERRSEGFAPSANTYMAMYSRRV